MQLFVDNLTHIDFSYLDPNRGLLGDTWLAHVLLEGTLNEQGMVCDFGIVKKKLRHWLDEKIDHRLLVPTQAENLSLDKQGDSLTLNWTFGNGKHLRCRSPHQAIALVDATTITPAHLCAWCIDQLNGCFPQSVNELNLSFTQQQLNGACYQYSHGLKKHHGNCQRIAHGHRSPIAIWQNGVPAPQLEQQWAQRWQDIYIGSQEDLVDSPKEKGVPYYHFAYRAQQGYFELFIPQSCCYLIDCDTTVEFLAEHIARTLKQRHPNSHIKVKAFEGLAKGAIAES